MRDDMYAELTPDELTHFNQLMGREVPRYLAVPTKVRLWIEAHQRDEARGRRYHRRVWSRFSLPAYIRDQANRCADFMMVASKSSSDSAPFTQDFRLPNPHGRAYPALGLVWLKYPAALPPDILPSEVHLCPAIDNISLHPSLRRRGFLRHLAQALGDRGARYLILNCITNPSLSYRLYQRSLAPSSHILVLYPDSPDPQVKLGPAVHVAWRLT